MVYGLETVAVTKKQVEEIEVAEMKILRFAMGVTRKYKIKNEHIRSTVKVERLLKGVRVMNPSPQSCLKLRIIPLTCMEEAVKN